MLNYDMPRVRPIYRAAILLDWRNLLGSETNKSRGIPASRFIRQTIFAVQEACAAAIAALGTGRRYQCRVRVYDGWHAARVPTPNRIDFEKLYTSPASADDFSRTIGRVSFPGRPEFGDQLVHDQRYGTLYDTHRAQGQKMVDTSIVADALALLMTNFADLVIIVSDDDDYIPAMVMGEALDQTIYLLRRHGHSMENVSAAVGSRSLKFWSGL
jgi:hypothetical protein